MHPRCAIFEDCKSEDIHHSRGRAGDLYLDTRFWIPLSRKAHHFVNQNPAKARAMTWQGRPIVAPLGKWNEPEP